jgi:esterase/lipase
MKKILINLFKIVFTIYALLLILLYIFQRDLLFIPQKYITHKYSEQIFINNNQKINIITLNEGKKDAIIYFGGNEENVVLNAPYFKKSFPNHTIYMFEYPSYGKSTGKATQENIFENSKLIFDKIQSKHQNISTIGRSLGTGVAIYLASKKPIYKLALITPYDTITNIAKDRYPIFPISFLIKDPFNSLKYITNIKSDILILLASSDKVIKHKFSYNLINHISKNKSIIKTIPKTTHSTIVSNKLTYQYLSKFFNTK